MKTAHQRIQEISKVMKRAVEKAAEKHRLMGVPMAVWKDGKVVEFLPEPAREPHGNNLLPSVTFLETKRKPAKK
jgi:hypothetical protein